MRLIEKKLCPKGKSAAKRKFSVYPSAYANMYASAVCSGKVKPGGKKKEKVNESAKEDYKKADSNRRAQATFNRVMPNEMGSELDTAVNKHSFARGYGQSSRQPKKVRGAKKKPSNLTRVPQNATPAKNRAQKETQKEKEKKLMNLALNDEEKYRKRTGKPQMPAALRRRR